MRREENKPEAPERKITMGSLFDGIGGFPLAAVRNGIEPVWASEIEAFPIAVTKLRFPQMRHVGDITKLDGAKLPPVDMICGGSPCQDLSISGARAGLAGQRSGLFHDQIRIIVVEPPNGKDVTAERKTKELSRWLNIEDSSCGLKATHLN